MKEVFYIIFTNFFRSFSTSVGIEQNFPLSNPWSALFLLILVLVSFHIQYLFTPAGPSPPPDLSFENNFCGMQQYVLVDVKMLSIPMHKNSTF